jgi:oxygen-dependent protoporphyrinogen oxidase
MSPPAFFASRLWTTGGKLRLLKEPFVGRAAREESIAQFVERRLGREFLDYAINPFVAGVYAGDPAALSVRAAFPKLYALEEKYGGLIRGMIGGARERKRRKEVAKDRAAMFSFRGGMETFPRAIARELGKDLHTKAEVESVVPRGSEWVIRWRSGGVSHERSARAVVLSIPAHAAARAVAPLLPALAGTLEGIVYPPVTEVFLGFRRGAFAQPLDGFGFLVPAVERRRILGTIWSSALFPERAPEGHDALTTFVGGARQPGLALLGDEEIIAAVTKELNSVLRGSAAPVFARVFRWEKAIPQYLLGYGKVVGEIEAAERSHPGLHFCSNYRGGIAVGDCVMSAHRTAERVKRQLGL